MIIIWIAKYNLRLDFLLVFGFVRTIILLILEMFSQENKQYDFLLNYVGFYIYWYVSQRLLFYSFVLFITVQNQSADRRISRTLNGTILDYNRTHCGDRITSTPLIFCNWIPEATFTFIFLTRRSKAHWRTIKTHPWGLNFALTNNKIESIIRNNVCTIKIIYFYGLSAREHRNKKTDKSTVLLRKFDFQSGNRNKINQPVLE